MHVPVKDAAVWIPDKHKKDLVPGDMPASLREAIRLFVLNCAARACRGYENTHNSMLIHVTRFVDVQSRVTNQVETELTALGNVIGLGAGANRDDLEKAFREIWHRRAVRPHDEFRSALKERIGEDPPELPEWGELWARVDNVLNRMRVMRISGDSADALAYTRNPDGMYVIAIGGDKLSRGLTLEGLSVSYFLRASAMFDTLMQMGRWFGYRPGYTHLCRVYTTPDLYSAFREIALAMEELRSELDLMETIQATPKYFGLRVRTPSDGLLITARNKIRQGEEVDVRFAGELVQALVMHRGPDGQAAENRAASIQLIDRLGPARRDVRGKSTAHFLWHDVDVSTVLEFLSQYEAFSTPSFYKRCDALQRYIHEQTNHDELLEWTVAVISRRQGEPVRVGKHDIPLVKRTPKDNAPPSMFCTQAVVGSADEAVDLSHDEFDEARKDTKTRDGTTPKAPDRWQVREIRPARRGLLLLYLIRDPTASLDQFVPAPAISFPTSKTAQPLTYTVNQVWRQQYGLSTDEADESTETE